MEREIKFRGWDTILKSMVEVFTIHWNSDNEIIGGYFLNKYGEENTFDTELQKLELMQFTGLKDRNGKEIYEGDICRFGSGRIKEIEYKGGGFGFQPDKEWRTEFVSFSGHNEFKILMEHIEVIGNIYETPKLLNDFM